MGRCFDQIPGRVTEPDCGGPIGMIVLSSHLFAIKDLKVYWR